jgi:hypothetical protein
VIIGIVTGLSMARLLTGIARFVQRPEPGELFGIHLGWALYLLLSVAHFWWFEFGTSPGVLWDFDLYIFTIFYTSLLFFTCVILFPDPGDAPQGFAEYFRLRRPWYYGLLAALFVADAVFSAMKAGVPPAGLPGPYLAKQGLLLALALVAIFARDRRFHLGFAILGIAVQSWWTLRGFGLSP